MNQPTVLLATTASHTDNVAGWNVLADAGVTVAPKPFAAGVPQNFVEVASQDTTLPEALEAAMEGDGSAVEDVFAEVLPALPTNVGATQIAAGQALLTALVILQNSATSLEEAVAALGEDVGTTAPARPVPAQLGASQGAGTGGLAGGENSPITLDCSLSWDWYGRLGGDVDLILQNLPVNQAVSLELQRAAGAVGDFSISAVGWRATLGKPGMSAGVSAVRLELIPSLVSTGGLMQLFEFEEPVPEPPPPPVADMLLLFDGAIVDAAGAFTPVVASGTPVFLADSGFGQALAWNGAQAGWLTLPVDSRFNPAEGIEVEARLYYSNYGDSGSPAKTGVLFFAGGVSSFGFHIQAAQSALYAASGSGGSFSSVSLPREQYNHVVYTIRIIGGQKRVSLAINGTWVFVDESGANIPDGPHSAILCGDTSINPSPANPHRYSYVAVRRLFKKYVPGVAFVPPTSQPGLEG